MTSARSRSDKRFYPLGLDLAGLNVVVVGGGRVAERKILRMLEFGPKVLVVSPQLSPALVDLAAQGKIAWEARVAIFRDVESAALVYVATDNALVNEQLAAHARQHGAIVNRADSAADCDFINPTSFEAGGLLITLQSHGAAPGYVKWARERLRAHAEGELAEGAWAFAMIRDEIKGLDLSQEERAELLQDILARGILERSLGGGLDSAIREARAVAELFIKERRSS